jgi:hypothetical protein
MDDQMFDQGREATTVQDLPAPDAGTQSLLNELSGMFEDFGAASPPKPTADTPQSLGRSNEEPVGRSLEESTEVPAPAVTSEVIPVTSPPRIEPPAAIIWKPARRRFRFRR